MRTACAGVVDPFDMDQMMELDMEVHHHDSFQPVAALSTMADSLPGLGIVAAVLGVVITMGSLGGPPEEIGHQGGAPRKELAHKGAPALVGTFLGATRVQAQRRRTSVALRTSRRKVPVRPVR